MLLARISLPTITTAALLLLVATSAYAQRFTFEKSLPAGSTTQLDVATDRGKIEISAGGDDHITVKGTVTVRIGPLVPANAPELAKKLADNPEIEQASGVVRLRPPSDDMTNRAVTVSYEIKVPAGAPVLAESSSGAISVDGVTGKLSVTTSSGAIALARLGGATEIKSSSGAVSVDEAKTDLRVATQSSAITLKDIRAGLHARSQSGSLSARFTGPGDVDVQTSSSEIALEDVHGSLTAESKSGKIVVAGKPAGPWTITTISSAQEIALLRDAPVDLDAMTRSGSIELKGVSVSGNTDKRRVEGKIGAGGPLVRLSSRSGSIVVSQSSR